MSLYNHVENKGDLLDGLTARVFERSPRGSTRASPGFAEEAAARSYRSLLGMLFGSVLTGTAGTGAAQAERAEPVGAWFRRVVTAAELPSLHRVRPALESGDCVQDFGYQLDRLVGGLRPTP
ncbi:hypothetical protein MUY14_40920 [Amycolatopsis sp. FBCC-B4732]|uniref:hypothetical protein n=1 Tax=Amycolatopsis sp. FBCC-B4732 TaxID=3079339 RepID=UPI001FF44EA2|nr:hypothetical protein [Amycolatopsis sp. FBCC-B4732]UOX88003.1 hypothetical protein MUY14_40920 [Amycolatopsis sp. FBCC-B4732]